MQTAPSWLSWIPTCIYAIGAAASMAQRSETAWRKLALSTGGALGAALLTGFMMWPWPGGAPRQASREAAAVFTTLIALLGWVIGDYSRRYLRGEAAQARFAAAFLTTLAGVTAVVTTASLPLVILAWGVSSAGLHHLLTFYRDRPAAMVVAHKKFLASRLAEACLMVAALLLYREWGSFDLGEIGEAARRATVLPWTASLAAMLIATAVLIKCAQLPLHGWLIEVMEAPTPVSALLHAGVVNLGGFVLIRAAPLLEASRPAQVLLVLVGSLTAVLAGLVMLTRVTIKVRLAWSTCSQMGLMITECGLGLYDVALLHLLAHALYKAHAFLTAGDTVRASLEREILKGVSCSTALPSLRAAIAALGSTFLIALVSMGVWQRALGIAMPPWITLWMLSCGMATLLWSPVATRSLNFQAPLLIIAAASICIAWHALIGGLSGMQVRPLSPVLAIWTCGLLLALYIAQLWALGTSPARLRKVAYRWAYAGLYLDERCTRLTFRLWPPKFRNAVHADGLPRGSVDESGLT